jgi:adenine deaminase
MTNTALSATLFISILGKRLYMPKADSSDINSRYELTKVALGETEADIAIVNGSIVNVYTSEVLAGDTVLIKGAKIAYVGQYAQRGIGLKTRIIDASGKVLVPGFIDGHTHMDYIYSGYELARYAMKTGTTTIITETAEIAFRLGYRGIVEYLKSNQNQPVKLWFTAPPMGTISPISREHSLTPAEIRRLLRRKDCVGTGETYWGPVVAGDRQQLEIMAETLKAGKKLEGHSAGATANKLQAYAALGITSDHEPTTVEETLERLRLGLSVMIREGEVRRELEVVSRIKDLKIDFRRLAISTDGIGPWQLTADGFMDALVQRAINLGFPPVQAIQMGTLNVAEHFNLHDFIGGIAPGRFADIVMIPDLSTIKPELVISNGQVVAQEGEIKVQPRRHVYPGFARNMVHLDKEFTARDFIVPNTSNQLTAKVRVIDQVSKILTREAVLELPILNGQIQMDAARDIVKVAAIEHIYTSGKIFTGFIRGLGIHKGAVATSTCWDSGDLTVAGASEADMALAVNRIRELNGGVVVCLNGRILAEVGLPIGSIISDEPMEVLAEKLTRVQQAAAELGCTSPDIRTTLSVLPTPAIPYLRICESGLFNVRLNETVELVIDQDQ